MISLQGVVVAPHMSQGWGIRTDSEHLRRLEEVRVLDGEVVRRLVLHERQVLRQVRVRQNGDRVQHGGSVRVAVRQLHPNVVRYLRQGA